MTTRFCGRWKPELTIARSTRWVGRLWQSNQHRGLQKRPAKGDTHQIWRNQAVAVESTARICRTFHGDPTIHSSIPFGNRGRRHRRGHRIACSLPRLWPSARVARLRRHFLACMRCPWNCQSGITKFSRRVHAAITVAPSRRKRVRSSSSSPASSFHLLAKNNPCNPSPHCYTAANLKQRESPHCSTCVVVI
jgi:hypothetical protein